MAKASLSRSDRPPHPGQELSAKKVPVQARALETVEAILRVAGDILDEAGFEQLNTNLVAKRAGISVPALYRYYPNKYAILNALGERIMQLQDKAVLAWLAEGGLDAIGTEARIASVQTILARILEITRAFPGNIAITRALRAVPAMRDARLVARDRLSVELGRGLGSLFPALPAFVLNHATKLCLELIQASMDMVLEEAGLDEQRMLRETARAFVAYFESLAQAAQAGAL